MVSYKFSISGFWWTCLHVLGCPEHDLTVSGKCLSVCDKNFVASVSQELINTI